MCMGFISLTTFLNWVESNFLFFKSRTTSSPYWSSRRLPSTCESSLLSSSSELEHSSSSLYCENLSLPGYFGEAWVLEVLAVITLETVGCFVVVVSTEDWFPLISTF